MEIIPNSPRFPMKSPKNPAFFHAQNPGHLRIHPTLRRRGWGAVQGRLLRLELLAGNGTLGTKKDGQIWIAMDSKYG